MSADEHKALIRRWIALWHDRNLSAVPEFVTPDYVRHDPHTPEVRGPAAEQQLMAMFLTAFPDLHFTLEDLVAEGDRVVARYTARGTQHGELLGIPPAGRQIAIAVVEIYRLAQGKIAEQWVIMDTLGMLQQLGALPAPGQAST